VSKPAIFATGPHAHRDAGTLTPAAAGGYLRWR